jgi:hypothetical protein
MPESYRREIPTQHRCQILKIGSATSAKLLNNTISSDPNLSTLRYSSRPSDTMWKSLATQRRPSCTLEISNSMPSIQSFGNDDSTYVFIDLEKGSPVERCKSAAASTSMKEQLPMSRDIEKALSYRQALKPDKAIPSHNNGQSRYIIPPKRSNSALRTRLSNATSLALSSEVKPRRKPYLTSLAYKDTGKSPFSPRPPPSRRASPPPMFSAHVNAVARGRGLPFPDKEGCKDVDEDLEVRDPSLTKFAAEYL